MTSSNAHSQIDKHLYRCYNHELNTLNFTPLSGLKIRPAENTLSTEAKVCFQNRSIISLAATVNTTLLWAKEISALTEVHDVYLNYSSEDNDTFREHYVYI